MAYYNDWKPYVSVAQRRTQAKREMNALRKRGTEIQPIEIEGRKIANTFWGAAWCDHLEAFSDYDNRLPRGRTYVRNGSVCHLAIQEGQIQAMVSGSEIYNIKIEIETLSPKKWSAVKQRCSGQIGSLIELLRGDLSDHIMEVVTDPEEGLFPLSEEITFKCDCPDWAYMCKHIAAVLYGIGARLDQDPALLFRLRGVKHDELIDVNAQIAVPSSNGRAGSKRIASDDLGDVFGIDLASDQPEVPSGNQVAKPRKAKTKKKAAARRKAAVKKKKPTKKTVVSKRSAKKKKSSDAIPKKPPTKVVKRKAARKVAKKRATAKGTTPDVVKPVSIEKVTSKQVKKKSAKKKAAKSKKAAKKANKKTVKKKAK